MSPVEEHSRYGGSPSLIMMDRLEEGFLALRFVRYSVQNFRMARKRGAPAGESLTPELFPGCGYQFGVRAQVLFEASNDLRSRSIFADDERIAPFRRPSNVHRISGCVGELDYKGLSLLIRRNRPRLHRHLWTQI